MSELFSPPFIIAVLIALTVHEWAHALVAYHLGDDTARLEGRMTLNPIAHLDPLGTLMFFVVHFGWGKPVPIDPRNFRHPRRDSALVALAGPFSNLLLAIAAFFLLLLVAPQMMRVGTATDLLFTPGVGERIQAFAAQILANSLFINLGLMAFNLLPLAPLDGSKIIHPFIPLKFEEQYEWLLAHGAYILITLLVLERAFDVPFILWWVSFIMDGVLGILMRFV